MYFYDLNEVKAQEMPGRDRKLVVGKNLMLLFVEREAGSVQEHTHSNEQMLYLMEGKATFRVGEEERTLEPGQVVHIPGGVPHRLMAHTRIRYLGIYSPPREAVISGDA
jgi:quercetin dioxygenase-like cupin family protein